MGKKKKRKGMFNPLIKDAEQFAAQNKARSGKIIEKIIKKKKETPDENRLFHEAMADVKPLTGKDHEIVLQKPKNIRPAHAAFDDELEGLMHLQNLVQGRIEMDITFSDEYIEGSISGISRRIMRRLKKGQFPIQDYIDLHGLTGKEAELTVKNFLINSQNRGLRCVLIVHGRGLNSPDSIPVLKERLPVWLNQGPARKIVLAFTSARQYDGGTGAIYVLLRKG